MKIIAVHDISVDGLPRREDAWNTAFLWGDNIISGWLSLPPDKPYPSRKDYDPWYHAWEAASTPIGGPFLGVYYWVEIDWEHTK